MKKGYVLLIISICMVFLTSCLEEYLDKAPESGLKGDEVFSTYANISRFFDGVYLGYSGTIVSEPDNYGYKMTIPLFFSGWSSFCWPSMTDESTQGNGAGWSQNARSGTAGLLTHGASSPFLRPCMMGIRCCNKTLQNINKLKDATQQDKDDIIAQAHFMRAHFNFELHRLFGPMPYLTWTIEADGEWDVPRLGKKEYLQKVIADLDTALTVFQKAGLMRRDPPPGQSGHLDHPNQRRPTGVAAKALKARVLLYMASPLNNEGANLWADAAIANWEALQLALSYSYGLLSKADYTKNWVGVRFNNEQLWAWDPNPASYQSYWYNLWPPAMTNHVWYIGVNPNQNTIDRFETMWGDPLETQAQRDAATALGHYKEQDPYVNRDPRFYDFIFYNQAPMTAFGKMEIWRQTVGGATVYSEWLDKKWPNLNFTGYNMRKGWGGMSYKNTITTQWTDALIRLAELYLNYAEAANEAYGPNGTAPGATVTAVQAVNVIRARVGMPDLRPEQTSSKDALRNAIKHEKFIEFLFEGGFRYHDIRRWMDAPDVYAKTVIYGMDIEKVSVTSENPAGFRYTRVPLPSTMQPEWYDYMYYWPMDLADTYKMTKFVCNPLWIKP